MTDHINNLFTDIQNCSDATECINFDLTKTLESFLSNLDKSILEYVEKKGRKESTGIGDQDQDQENQNESDSDLDLEDEEKKESTDQFNSAAVFVEGCVKIFSQKIEYLHNLAHNALYNIYREHRPGTNPKKHFVPTSYEEEDYLFVHEMKYLKNYPQEHEVNDDDLLVKTIPFPTFLFKESIKEKEAGTSENSKEKQEMEIIEKGKEEEEEENEKENEKEKEKKEKKSETEKKKDKLKDQKGENEYTEKNNNENKIKEEMEKIGEFAVSENAAISSLNFQKLYLEDDGILLLDINDYNVFVSDQYDFSQHNSSSALLFQQFDYLSKQQSLHSSANFSDFVEEFNHKENCKSINDIEDLLSDSLCYDYYLFKEHRNDFDLALGILKNKKAILKKFTEKQNELAILEENTHLDIDKCLVIENNIRLLPHFYSLNCSDIKDQKTFFRFMQPNEIIEIIKDNNEDLENQKKKRHGDEEKNRTEEAAEKRLKNLNLSSDERIYEEIAIPELYIQKLNLNLSYYYLEPLIHNLIKDFRKKRNVQKFFSIDVDDKPRISFEDAIDDDSNDLKNQEGQKNITLDNFIGGMNSMNANADLEFGGMDKLNSSGQFLVNYDDNIHDRINKWNKFLEMKLEILKKQPKFDVDHYKKKLINYTVNKGNKTNFSKLINNKEPYEICRNFLTTLMLINAGVLEIGKKKHADETNDVTNYEVKIKADKANQYLHHKIAKNASFIIDETNKRKKNNPVFVPSKKSKKAAVV